MPKLKIVNKTGHMAGFDNIYYRNFPSLLETKNLN